MGNPFCHVDLSCDDVGAAKKFYKAVFDWKFQDFPAMDWTGIRVGEPPLVGGGMGKKQMPGQPSAWTAYVDVKDVKKTLAKAEKAGATVVLPFMPVGEMGFIGVFVDPQGAAIGVWQQAKKPAPKPAAKKAAAKKAAPKKAAPKKAAAKKPAAKKPAAKKK